MALLVQVHRPLKAVLFPPLCEKLGCLVSSCCSLPYKLYLIRIPLSRWLCLCLQLCWHRWSWSLLQHNTTDPPTLDPASANQPSKQAFSVDRGRLSLTSTNTKGGVAPQLLHSSTRDLQRSSCRQLLSFITDDFIRSSC